VSGKTGGLAVRVCFLRFEESGWRAGFMGVWMDGWLNGIVFWWCSEACLFCFFVLWLNSLVGKV